MIVCIFTIIANDFKLPPYGLYALKAYVNQYGKDLGAKIQILTFYTHESSENIIKKIAEYSPDVIAGSIYVWNYNSSLDILRKVKSKIPKKLTVIAGGPSCSFDDENLRKLLLEKKIDSFILGEGEKALLHTLNCVKNDIKIFPTRGLICISNLNNSLSQDDGKEYNLDYLPNPYKALPELAKLSLDIGVVQYESSRGCPNSCTFCDQGHKKFKSLSLDRIKEDINFFATLYPKHMNFLDGTFNYSSNRTKAILKYIINLDLKCTIHAEIKPETLSEEEVVLMKKANFKSVEIGLQTINEKTLKILNRHYVRNRFENSVQMLLDEGVEVVIDTIIGLPTEGIKEWYESIDYSFSLGRVKIVSNILKILPNTELEKKAKNFNLIYNNQNCRALISSDKFSNGDIKKALLINRLINEFWNKFGMPKSIRKIVENFFNNKFHYFLDYLLEYLLSDFDISKSYINHINIILNILSKVCPKEGLNEEIISGLVYDFSKRGSEFIETNIAIK